MFSIIMSDDLRKFIYNKVKSRCSQTEVILVKNELSNNAEGV